MLDWLKKKDPREVRDKRLATSVYTAREVHEALVDWVVGSLTDEASMRASSAIMSCLKKGTIVLAGIEEGRFRWTIPEGAPWVLEEAHNAE